MNSHIHIIILFVSAGIVYAKCPVVQIFQDFSQISDMLKAHKIAGEIIKKLLIFSLFPSGGYMLYYQKCV